MLPLLAVVVLLAGGAGLGTTAAAKAVHLLCFATSWGVTVWAILVGGVIMFLYYTFSPCSFNVLPPNLPRHAMGRLRGKVFPACFALNAACTAASAEAFAWLHRPPWPPAERRQLAVLLVAAGYDLANLLIFTPRTLEAMRERHKVERSLGIGGDGSFVGWRQNARAARSSSTLAAENARFWVAHSFSAVALVISAAGLFSHFCCLSGKIVI
uniref:TMEM205-like domain-containing protein n=1 Tax=Oryza glumipatula TaxID=40148 RepID=A0A0E0BU02_9ORYZ